MGASILLTIGFAIAWFVYTIWFQPRGPGIPQSDDTISPVLGLMVFAGAVLQHLFGLLGIVALFQRNTRKIAPGFAAGCGLLLLLFWLLFMALAIAGASV